MRNAANEAKRRRFETAYLKEQVDDVAMGF
jgi:hypothetical protein